MDAVDLLVRQHREIEVALGQVLTAAYEREKQILFTRVAELLAGHITAEERIFYPGISGKRTEDILLDWRDDHRSLKELIRELLALPPSAETFESRFELLAAEAVRHFKGEEEHLFPKVVNLVNKALRQALGLEMLVLQRNLERANDPRVLVVEEHATRSPGALSGSTRAAAPAPLAPRRSTRTKRLPGLRDRVP